MNIMQGSQFAIEFEVSVNGETATPENVDGVRIQLGPYLAHYPADSEDDTVLHYDEETETWDFWLTEKISLALPGSAKCPVQTEVKLGDSVIPGPVQLIDIGASLIRKEWT